MLYFTNSPEILGAMSAMIVKTLVVGLLAVNCYIVGSSSSRQAMIIDAGAEAETIRHRQ
ncbi:MAG: MBL fold metallo-hydrolase [Dehalococcoidia bacterium]